MILKFPNIVCTEDTMFGSPRIIGRRLAVGDIVCSINNYGNIHEVVVEYELTIFEIKQSLEYCSSLQCKSDKPKVFCHNCTLRRQQDGPLDTTNLNETILDDENLVEGNNSIYLGSLSNKLEDWNGRTWWKTATELLIKWRNELD